MNDLLLADDKLISRVGKQATMLSMTINRE